MMVTHKKWVLRKTKYTTFVCLFFGMILLFGMVTSSGTIIIVDPFIQTVSPGKEFTIDIYCSPDQPIKSFEFKLSFDALLLEANSVTEGDIFDGYQTYFNPGFINNVDGLILNVFGLIVGQGNVTDPGTFATISFTAKTSLSTTLLHLYDTGVTDEAGYISIVTNDENVTIYSSEPSDDGGVSPGGGGGITPPPIIEQNTPPNQPTEPEGPTLIERGVTYEYSSYTTDTDGDTVRFMFDWGDGNYSNWSNLVTSNTTVSMSHYWDSISNFIIKVLAQDKKGLNSTWSEHLIVTVSETSTGEKPPYAEIKIPDKVVSNQTIVFDATDSYDLDGAIVSYYWDFDDGENENGTNATTTHIYRTPGYYTATLVITDNDGNTYSASINVNVASEATGEDFLEKEDGNLSSSVNLIIIIIGVIVLFVVFLVILFRIRIGSKLLQYQLDYQARKIKKLKQKFKK